MFCIVFSGAVPLPNYQGLSTNDVQPEIQLGKKVEWKKECFQGLDHKYKNWGKKYWRVVRSKQMCHFKSCKVQKSVRCMQNCFRAANPPKQTTAGTFSGLAEIKRWDSHIHTRTNTSSYKATCVYISSLMTWILYRTSKGIFWNKMCC